MLFTARLRPARSPWLCVGILLLLSVLNLAATASGRQVPGNPGRAPAAPGVGTERDLTTRYRFREQYASVDRPGCLWQYDVAFRDVVRISQQTDQGAPELNEFVRSARYTERPYEVPEVDRQSIVSLIRRYDTAELSPDNLTQPDGPRLMQDLVLWIGDAGGDRPRVISLPPGRPVRWLEYRFIQDEPYLPSIALLLPNAAIRVGETWSLSPIATMALLGEKVSGSPLLARLVEIVPPGAGETSERAHIDIEGRVQAESGLTHVRARCTFDFRVADPAAAGAARPAGSRTVPVLEAEGGITKIRMATATTLAGQAEGSRSGERRRELILERRLTSAEPAMARPQALPTLTVENSWLLFVDPKNRFHFFHPQDFVNNRADAYITADAFVLLREGGASRPDLVRLNFLEDEQPKPEEAFEPMLKGYRDTGLDILKGGVKRLADEGWANREAFRVEAMLAPPAPDADAVALPRGQRVHFDGYVVQFPGKASVTAAVFSVREDVDEVRLIVEKILQQFRLGPPGFATRQP